MMATIRLVNGQLILVDENIETVFESILRGNKSGWLRFEGQDNIYEETHTYMVRLDSIICVDEA